jgi:predicted site-specific integrase-resolvase
MYIPLRKAKERLGLHGDTIRKYADKGIIPSIRTEGGKRLFDIDEYIRRKNGECNHSTICYCRVSSPKQKDDLERQVNYMQERYPDSEIVTDIGSGINYKRKGLNSILERALQGDKLKIVVAYKDRLARFGFELIESMLKARFLNSAKRAKDMKCGRPQDHIVDINKKVDYVKYRLKRHLLVYILYTMLATGFY